MYRLSDTTKANLEKSLGMSLDSFNQMSADQERQWAEKKIKRKLTFSKKRRRQFIGRGNPLIARRKLRTIEDLEHKSKNLFGV